MLVGVAMNLWTRRTLAVARSSVIDPLTGVFNRCYMANRVAAEIASARHDGTEIAVLLTDVDNLKDLRNRLGRAAGDRALRAVGLSPWSPSII